MTVQEIVELPVLRGAKVLTTPEQGLGRDVASVSVMEVPVDSFIRPGEFVMSTGMNIGQDRKLLACFVRDVARAGASALALAIGPYTRRIPTAVIQLAKKEGLALIELAWKLRFSEVSEAILRQLIHEQAVIRSRDDFVWSLANHNLTEEAAVAGAKHLGYDLSRVFVGLFGKVSGSAAIQDQARLAEKLCNTVAARNRLQWFGTVMGDSIIGYLQTSRTAPGISALLKQVRMLAAGRFTITWGVGRSCRAFADFHRSYVDANAACEIGARVRGVGSTTDATDVLADRILMNLRRDGDAAMLLDRYIKPLEESRRMPLLATLEAFFHHDCNASEASRSLSISRQAFLYRMARAETLMRVDLQNAEHRFAISLALRLRRFQDRPDLE
jgi:DNA-binding PucR family transcriptional regulator